MTRACKTCQWWRAWPEDSQYGVCLAHPPSVDQGAAVWPTTNADAGCGAHQIRAELVGGDVRKPNPHQDGEA